MVSLNRSKNQAESSSVLVEGEKSKETLQIVWTMEKVRFKKKQEWLQMKVNDCETHYICSWMREVRYDMKNKNSPQHSEFEAYIHETPMGTYCSYLFWGFL